MELCYIVLNMKFYLLFFISLFSLFSFSKGIGPLASITMGETMGETLVVPFAVNFLEKMESSVRAEAPVRPLIEKMRKQLTSYPFEEKQQKTAEQKTATENNTKAQNKEAQKQKAENKTQANNKETEKQTIENNTKVEQKTKEQKTKAEKRTAKNPASPCTVELKIEGAIGAGTLDIMDRAIYEVKKQQCSALLLLINTPGGQLLSTRKIVDRILNVDFPVLCLIHPAGAHAGSAGAIIMQACHVNGGIETTNIGAATPIMGGGKKMSEDLRKKMINDTVSWLDSLTQLRKRNKKFGREIVTEAKALSAKEAVKIGGIDFAGKTKREFLQFAEGRKITIKDGKTQVVQVGEVLPLELGFRYRLISLMTEPEIIYILFTGSLMLLYYEITHPGLGAPGVLGIMGLIISFMGMHKLDFSWAGLLLLLLSMVLFLAEVFISGFGIFGVGAIVSFFLGSFLLFDPAKTGGMDIPLSLIFSVTFVFSLFMGLIAWMAWSSFKIRKTKDLSEDFMEKNAPLAEVMVVNEDGLSGMVFIRGENWSFKSKEKVKQGDKVKVLSEKDLVLTVSPINNS